MGVVKNSPPSRGSHAPGNRHIPPCVTGEHPQVFFKRQVGRGSPAVGWGAVGLTCRLCYPVPGCPGLALVTWWQSGCLCAWMLISITPCPVQAVALGLNTPACIRSGEGEGTGRSLRFGLLLLPPATTPHFTSLSLLKMELGGQSCNSTQRQADSS